MAASANPNDDTIASIQAQIAAAQAQLTVAQAALAADNARVNDWMMNTPSHGQSADARAAIADAQNNAVLHQGQIDAAKTLIASLQKQLTTAQEKQGTFADALADAASIGLTGDAAIAHAQAAVEESKGKKALMIAAAIALVVVVIAALLWLKHRKKK